MVLVGMVIFVSFKVFRNHLLSSPAFTIKTLIYTGALKPLSATDIFKLKGKNLFSVDIGHLARDLKLSYPHLAKIRVSRIIPDKIWFEAEERVAFAKVKLADRVFLCDAEATIMPLSKLPSDLVLITGVETQVSKIRIGEVYDSSQLKTALAILKEIKNSRAITPFLVVRLEVDEPERIAFFLDNGIQVIIGNEQTGKRLKVLSLVLNDLKPELDKIKYIDLRFQEPAIGKR